MYYTLYKKLNDEYTTLLNDVQSLNDKNNLILEYNKKVEKIDEMD